MRYKTPYPTPRHPYEPEMVYVEGGTFTMGRTGFNSVPDEGPPHEVMLSDFIISKYEVTQAQWKMVMGATVARQRHKSTYRPRKLHGADDDYPMYYVSWDEVQGFVRRMNAATGKNYTLPSEAQWDAARGENKSKGYSRASGSDNPYEVAWLAAGGPKPSREAKRP